jgi:lipoprotein LprG
MVATVPPRSLLVALAAVAAVLLTGCTAASSGPSETLPPAADLLTRSAEAMGQVSTATLDIQVDPALAVPVRAATGSVTASGDAIGTATLARAGPPVEFAFVVTGGRLYLKGPTGGFSPPIPLSLAGSFYNPTALLDPDRGVARLLATARPHETQAREEVDGVDTYRVAATFSQEAANAIVPAVPGPVDGLLWIDAATSRLIRAELQVPGTADGGTAPVTVRLSEFNAPVTVTPPG